jgi:hypothetical protein
LGEAEAALRESAGHVLGGYAWFLETLSREKTSAIRWLGRAGNHRIADNHARLYRDAFFDLLEAAGGGGQLLGYAWM